jgi:hypothetical protein
MIRQIESDIGHKDFKTRHLEPAETDFRTFEMCLLAHGFLGRLGACHLLLMNV